MDGTGFPRAAMSDKVPIGIEYMGELPTERTLWPIRPWPMPDELLSSWLNRVAVANGISPWSFYRALARAVGWTTTITRFEKIAIDLRHKSKETSWVDFRCDNPLAEYLAQRSGMPPRLIQGLALKRPHDIPAGVLTPAGTLQWDLIEAVPRLLRLDGEGYRYMYFCPYCLAEWDDPWYRKFWRTKLAQVCTRHGCQMFVSCICGRDVRPHLSKKVRSQAFCHSCGQDLRALDAKPAFPNEMRHQREMNRRAYEEVELILRNRGDQSLISQMVNKRTDYKSKDGVYVGRPKRALDLRKTGLIDAYGQNSALSLFFIYRDLRRRTSGVRCV
jgi:ribosomal protein L34E